MDDRVTVNLAVLEQELRRNRSITRWKLGEGAWDVADVMATVRSVGGDAT